MDQVSDIIAFNSCIAAVNLWLPWAVEAAAERLEAAAAAPGADAAVSHEALRSLLEPLTEQLIAEASAEVL